MASKGKSRTRTAHTSNPLEDVERVAHLLMNEAQMSLKNAGRIVGKLIAVSVIGFTLASNCCFSWHLVPVGVITLAIAAGWLDAIGKECSNHRFFPQKSLNSVGASLFKWQWVVVWAFILFGLSFGLSMQFTLSYRLSKVLWMALIPLALMLLARTLEPFNFQHARGDIQKAEALVRQLATNLKPVDNSAPAPLIEHEKIPVYKLGSVAKVLHDIAAGYDTNAKLKVDLSQSNGANQKGAFQQMLSLVYAPFRRVASDVFLWEKRDLALYVVAALYVGMVYRCSAHMMCALRVGAFFSPLLVLVPFMVFKSKACRYAQTLQENIRTEQRRASTPPSVPLEELPTVGEVRASIPAECFERSAVKSLLLVLRDGTIIASFATLATLLLRVPGGKESLTLFDWFGWAMYAFWQGTAFTGWWVLAHECGHGGFSASTALNDAVGYVLHTVLLVPYFSWQYSHAKHHSKTNHLVDGESHVPDTHDDLEDIGFVQLYRLIGRPAYAVVQLIAHLVFGWPAYLLFNVTGGRRLAGKPVTKPFNFTTDHFRPNSDLFPPSWRGRIAVSALGVFVVLGVVAWSAWNYGPGAVFAYYLMPYLWCNFWLVLYTWMQHTDPTVPHYGDSEWTWLRGALCTIDRPYGIFDWFHHHIGSTHVCHHLFSKVPCYNAVKATEHLKAFLEPRGLYRYDPTFWPIAAWKVAMTCHYVEGVEGTQYYKQLHSKADDKEEQSYEPHLWYIHGNSYDLAPFVEKHPGGQLAILSARGRECTALFESYHPWSDKNRKVLAAYGPKPPPCDPFYEELKLGVRKLFPGGPKETKMRSWTLCCLLVAWAATMYLMFYVKTWWSCLAAGVLISLFGTRLAHEGGHMQASHYAWVNRVMNFIGYLPIGPGLCWYYRHVISHHVHTNSDDDVDVRYIEFIDMVPKRFKYIKALFLPIIFAGAVFEIGVKTLFDMLVLEDVGGCRVYRSIGLLIPEAIVWLAIHLAFGPSLLCYGCMALTAGAIFVPMSQVAHAILYPDGVEDESWAKMQLKTSVNFAARSSFWYHLAFGLTTQTDHHLFPGIGAHCLDDIHDKVVKPVCAKHGVPVYDVSAKKAFGALWHRLLENEPAKIM